MITVISDTNQNLGLKSLREALKLFDPMTHDLVLVSVSSDDESPQAVCKIISRKEAYDKLRASKLKAKEKPDKQRTDVLKEMEIGSGIGQHDLGIKLKKARDMFGKGYRVQFTLVYRGKETRNNKDVLTDIQAQLADCAALNGEPSVAGKKMIVKFVPTVPKKGAE
ncbi:hypothetical protein HK097_002456 [Rhizophlyctis rosea]|uniref:Translation initiation factor IF-3 n=1 Tax=Rhizophlyctis rosea TaxID=64517 RepID=A0AAD5SMV2_9FUNG|nr:hypothetical protein HK097_002456 [Rhizophlyctis rosea]